MVTDETRLIILKHIEILQHYAVYQEQTWFCRSITLQKQTPRKRDHTYDNQTRQIGGVEIG